MKRKRGKTFYVEICCAGSYEKAIEICQNYCDEIGLCVTIEKCIYVYTGGNEEGIKVRLVQYPRFPKKEEEILLLAQHLTFELIQGLEQKTALLITPTETIWYNDKY